MTLQQAFDETRKLVGRHFIHITVELEYKPFDDVPLKTSVRIFNPTLNESIAGENFHEALVKQREMMVAHVMKMKLTDGDIKDADFDLIMDTIEKDNNETESETK